MKMKTYFSLNTMIATCFCWNHQVKLKQDETAGSLKYAKFQNNDFIVN